MAVLHSLAVDFNAFVNQVPMTKATYALLLGVAWSYFLKTRNDKHMLTHKHGFKIQWWKQHTTPMYIIFFATLLCELSTFWDELHAPDQEATFGGAMQNSTPHMQHCMAAWREDQALDAAHSPWIYQVASAAPLFATLTVCIGAFATLRHVRTAGRHGRHCLWDTNRGATLWILQLPVVYSLTALFSVQKGLKQARLGGYMCINNDDSPQFLMETGLSFGDAYEAISLLLFANITMNVIENTVDKLVLDAEAVKKAFSNIETAVDVKLPKDDVGSIRQEFHTLTVANAKVMTRLEQMSEKLTHSTWELSMLGIKYFAFTCLVIATPQILACKARTNGWVGAYSALKGFSASWAVTFKGMGLLGSCVAIHNMVSIESNFDEAFLQGFTAKLKFISVKIMVSIVFMQEMALPIAFNLTPARASLFDASLRVIEFTFISIFNFWAWPLEQDFYEMEAIEIEGMEDLQENLIENLVEEGNIRSSLRAMPAQQD